MVEGLRDRGREPPGPAAPAAPAGQASAERCWRHHEELASVVGDQAWRWRGPGGTGSSANTEEVPGKLGQGGHPTGLKGEGLQSGGADSAGTKRHGCALMGSDECRGGPDSQGVPGHT